MRFCYLIGLCCAFPVLANEAETLKRLAQCRQTQSSLERLDCYDSAWQDSTPHAIPAGQRSASWLRATEQEKGRETHSTQFITKESSVEDIPQVVLTTPALGIAPPRPILMLSCIDNITRLQLILHRPIAGRELPISIETDKTRFQSRWFSRDSGYILEASRGLQGIREIQQLFGATQMTIKLQSGEPRWTFNIQNIEQDIKSFRQACHW
ncbi:type VI secretion system-associated protein VasI [Muribacter muris]|uniref:type VI secretion system-associated protein VasI n=1 Tax=Muribacter muris TaxID=67855 RepID=UPI00064D760A|nr:type VI secretion system-associated protein VasI [Muribacter muris]